MSTMTSELLQHARPIPFFFYGSLMSYAVFERVLSPPLAACFQQEPALLPGHVRFRVCNQLYPGALPAKDYVRAVRSSTIDSSSVDGILMHFCGDANANIIMEVLRRLDQFECVGVCGESRVGEDILQSAQNFNNFSSKHLYRREIVEVHTHNNAKVQAFTYIWSGGDQNVSCEPWTLDDFDLNAFLHSDQF